MASSRARSSCYCVRGLPAQHQVHEVMAPGLYAATGAAPWPRSFPPQGKAAPSPDQHGNESFCAAPTLPAAGRRFLPPPPPTSASPLSRAHFPQGRRRRHSAARRRLGLRLDPRDGHTLRLIPRLSRLCWWGLSGGDGSLEVPAVGPRPAAAPIAPGAPPPGPRDGHTPADSRLSRALLRGSIRRRWKPGDPRSRVSACGGPIAPGALPLGPPRRPRPGHWIPCLSPASCGALSGGGEASVSSGRLRPCGRLLSQQIKFWPRPHDGLTPAGSIYNYLCHGFYPAAMESPGVPQQAAPSGGCPIAWGSASLTLMTALLSLVSGL